MRKVFLLKNLTYILIIFCFLLASGCKPLYNNNGWSVWGWSKSKNQAETHVGFISTDFLIQNAERGSQVRGESRKLEEDLKEELGFGTVGIFYKKEY